METTENVIEIEVNHTTKIKVAVPLPCFRKTISRAYKVVNKDKCVYVSLPGTFCSPEVSAAHAELAFQSDGVEITEGEFISLYNAAMEEMNQLAVK